MSCVAMVTALIESIRGIAVTGLQASLLVAMASRRIAPVSGPRLFVHDDAALHLALLHEVEGVVEIGEWQAAADELLELVLAVHEEVEEQWHVRALVPASERRAGEHALLEEHAGIDGQSRC